LITLLCFGLAIGDADAARFGGGRSSGIQRNNVVQKQAAPPAASPNQTATNQAAAAKPAQPAPAVAPAVPPAPAPSGMSRWLGPLAGLAAGAGLASLFMGGGMGGFGGGGGFGGILMLLLLAGGAYFLFASFRRRAQAGSPNQQTPLQYADANAGYAPPLNAAPGPVYIGSGTAAPVLAPVALASSTAAIPVGFDKEGFLRQAKVNFMRMQAANDRKDLKDIRNFTTPEMFAEISMEAQERGSAEQQVDVAELNAELLDVTEGSDEHLASVRFYGSLREAANGPLENFDEVWHLAKSADGRTGWLVAGIQQVA
jgi:predicted lipid-binding transport protein (Tim44 family)